MRQSVAAHPVPGRASQRGVTIVIALIALTVLLLSGVALIRSLDTSMTTAGNLAFRRDLSNQAERAVAKALENLNNLADRNTTTPSKNYSATMLTTNAYGIPTVLLDDTAYAAAGWVAPDLSDSASGISSIRYVIDRLCAAGTTTPSASSCANTYKQRLGTPVCDSLECGRPQASAPARYIYRISVRAIGPRGTVAFVQSTYMR